MDDESNTPLNLAAQNGHNEMVIYFHREKMKRNKKRKPRKRKNEEISGNDSESNTCTICAGPRDGIYAFQPCGHSSSCQKCCEKLTKKAKPTCPYCRASVTHFQQIFLQADS